MGVASVAVAGPGAARYGLGVACLIVMALTLGSAARRLRRRWLPGHSGAAARLAEAVIGLALLVGEMELLGAVGWFRLVPLVLGAVVIGLAVDRWVPAAPAGPGGAKAPAPPRRESRLALAAGAAVLAEWLGPTLQSYTVGIHSFDSVWYHLPWAASFAQTGQITPLRFFDVDYLTGLYPATAELVHGLGIVLLGRDTLSPGLNLVWLGLVLLAAWCLGRGGGNRNLGPATMLGAAVALATPMMRGSQAGTAANDAVAVFFLLAACALVPDEAGEDPPLALAAVAAGLAIATKLTAVVGVLGLSLGVIWLARERRRRAGAIWLSGLILAGGYWYARDLIATGSPFPFVHIPGLPVPAPTPQAHTGFSIAHYLGNGHILSGVFAPALHAGFGLAWPALLIATILAPLLCLAPGADRRTRMLGAVALVAAAGYVVTPQTAAGPSGDPAGFAFNLRYAAPALTLSLAVLPLAPVWRGQRGRAVAFGGLVVLFVLTLARPGSWKGPHLLAAVVIAVGLLGLAAAGRRWPPRRPALVMATVALVVAAVLSGYFGQRHYLRGRYAFTPRVSHLSRVWAMFRGIHDARVGVAGTYGEFFAYPLLGLDDSNRVAPIAARGPHGSFTPIAACAAWRRTINAGHFTYVLITPGRSPWSPRLRGSPEAAWITGAAGAEPVLRYRAERQPIVVYRLRGKLDSSGCRGG